MPTTIAPVAAIADAIDEITSTPSTTAPLVPQLEVIEREFPAEASMTSTVLPPTPGSDALHESFNRDALLAYAYHLYDRPGSSSPGLTSIPLTNPLPALASPEQVYKLRLLPLLTTMRTLYPQDLSILLLMACTYHALGNFEASLQVSQDILAINPDFVRISITFTFVCKKLDLDRTFE